LDDLKKQGVTVMVAIHDLNQAMQYFDQAILLNKSLIAFGPPRKVFSSRNIQAAFADKVMMVDGAAVTDDCCPPTINKIRKK
jgi:ABC-type Mn2+/Zn2+ transport system ATPase subunit